MEQKTSLKVILAMLGGTLTVVLTMLALVPFLNELLAVEVVQAEMPTVTSAPVPEKPVEVPVTVYYQMEENSKKISAIYVEVFPVGSGRICYMEIPADTKVNLSEELYKSLQTYAPELPQYLKLSNMAESFSKEYGLTGCNRILSEVLGISLKEYVRADAEAMAEWFALQEKDNTAEEFFKGYANWLTETEHSLMVEECWTYYESRQQVDTIIIESAPGSREKDGYLISGKRSKERLQEWMLR